jgi:hypothetical protein
MIVAEHTALGRAACRTVYVVKCDRCGNEHQDPGILPDQSVYNAALSGWHVASLMPDDDWQNHPVRCPLCRMRDA